MSKPAAPRVDPDAIRETLRAAGLRARHALSQNFLADPDVLDAILAEAGPPPGRRVLEIGPGLGLLTDGLLTALGQAGVLPPPLAAWGAPIAFACGAVTVLLYAEG